MTRQGGGGGAKRGGSTNSESNSELLVDLTQDGNVSSSRTADLKMLQSALSRFTLRIINNTIKNPGVRI